MYKVFATQSFKKQIPRFLDKYENERLEILYTELANYGNIVGKTLTYKFLREKKIRNKRIYYLVYEDLKCVLIVGVSNKKTQQTVINKIKKELGEYRKYVEKII